MKTDIQYITELTRADIAEIAAAVDPMPGFCIRIDKVEGRLRISVDERALAMAINGFVRNGGTQTNAVNAQNVSFDPPS